MTVAGGTIAGLIEIKWQKAAPRKTFARRRSGSIAAALLTFLVTAVFGGVAAVGTWLLT
jgi:dolichol kinase